MKEFIEYFVITFFLLIFPIIIWRGILIFRLLGIGWLNLLSPSVLFDFLERLMLDTNISTSEIDPIYENNRKTYKKLTILFWVLLASIFIIIIGELIFTKTK